MNGEPAMIIDSHLHVWDPSRANYPWLDDGLGSVNRAISFDEIAPALAERGIGGAVLVQASDNAEDTDVMLAVAARQPAVLGVVAWTPLDRPGQVALDLQRLGAIVVGVRNLVHEREREWVLQPAVGDSLELLAAAGVPLDFPTADYAALAAIATLGERHPSLTIVIDHLGKPPIGRDEAAHVEWRALLAECADNPRTVAKVSGLYASVGPLDSWTVDAVRPFIEDALDLLGADRLLYGGDWPISELAGGYARTWDAVTGILDSQPASVRAAILGGTAARVYRLG